MLAHLHFWVQNKQSSYQRRTRSWRGGLSISMLYETGHLLSTTRPLNDCRKSQWTSHSISLQPWGKFRQVSVNYPAAKDLDLTQFLRKSMRRVDQHWWVNFWLSFSWYRWKNNYCRTSRTPPSSIFTNRKGTNRHTIITAVSLYFQFQARS